MPSSLYICYFGLREPLVQTQVLPYLREIRKDGIEVSLVTFEPDMIERWSDGQIADERALLDAEGIRWHFLPYHKWPSVPATAWDILRGALFVRSQHRRAAFDILHCRGHIPALIAALARKVSAKKPKLLFDIRGFFPEEYTDAGIWPEGGWLYRAAKRVERWLMKQADGFVVLTKKAQEILFLGSRTTGRDRLGRPVEVIPCCVDLKRFGSEGNIGSAAIRRELGIGERKVIAYVGSFGGWYLTDVMLDLFDTARKIDPALFVMVLTQRDKEGVREQLLKRGFGASDLFVESVGPSEMARYLAAADTAVSVIKACYSKLSSSPTKIAEYLACGVPVICNRGVGDIDELIDGNGVGVLLDGFGHEDFVRALTAVGLLGDVRERCKKTARHEFDLETVGGDRYRRIYSALLEP